MTAPPDLAGTSRALNVEAAADAPAEYFVAPPEVAVAPTPAEEMSAAATDPGRRAAEPPLAPAELASPDFPQETAVLPVSAAAHRVASPPPATTVRAPRPLPRRPPTETLTMVGARALESPGIDATHPEPLDNELPRYPAAALRAGWQGTVTLRLEITATGEVARVAVADSSGHAVLDEAAASAVRQWRFRPASQDGRNVAATVLLPVVFELPTPARASAFSTRLSN